MSARTANSLIPWIIVSGGFNAHGGQDKANIALARHLLSRGHIVHIVTHEIVPDLQQHPHARVSLVKRPFNSCFLGDFPVAAEFRRVVRRVRAQHPAARIVANGSAGISDDINWVHYVHHAWNVRVEPAPLRSYLPAFAKERLYNAIARRRERRSIPVASIVIANSERTKRDLQQFLAIPATTIKTVYLGSDPTWNVPDLAERAAARAHYEQPPGRPVAAFVGAFDPADRKGFNVLFAAWSQLCARPDWDVDLLVAGAGPRLNFWRFKVARAGLEQRIRMFGFHPEIPRLLAAADLLVSPTRYDSFGLNVQEALCRGVPAMVSASAGVAERYPVELHDLLIPDPEKVSDLVERLLRWRATADQWRAAVQPLSEKLRAYSWGDSAAAFVASVEDASVPTLANVCRRENESNPD